MIFIAITISFSLSLVENYKSRVMRIRIVSFCLPKLTQYRDSNHHTAVVTVTTTLKLLSFYILCSTFRMTNLCDHS